MHWRNVINRSDALFYISTAFTLYGRYGNRAMSEQIQRDYCDPVVYKSNSID